MERNEPCACGSGKKYKKCCLAKDEAAAAMRRLEEQRRVEAEAEAARRMREEERAVWEKARRPAPSGTPDDEFTSDSAAKARELGWPPLTVESEKLVDAWWEEVHPVYVGKDGLKQSGWLLERTVAFLDEHPQLFRYLFLHEEFLLEVGAWLDRAGRRTDHHELLLRLRGEQPEVHSQGFGFWDFNLLVESLRSGQREDIQACLPRFREEPIKFIDQFAEVVDLLAWHGCEAELRWLLEPTAAIIEDSPDVLNGGFGMRWLTHLAMFPLLESGDDTPEAFGGMCQQVMAVGCLEDNHRNREWLRRAVLMALPTEAESGLDLKQPHSVQFDGDVAWSFAGWLRRTKGLRWASARFLAGIMLDYWHWTENKQKGLKRGRKKGGKTKAAATFSLDAGRLGDFLDNYCRGFFGIRTLTALPAIQSYHYFTEYLVERGHLSDEQASQVRTEATVHFIRVRNLVDVNDPIYQIYPTYEELITGARLHLES